MSPKITYCRNFEKSTTVPNSVQDQLFQEKAQGIKENEKRQKADKINYEKKGKTKCMNKETVSRLIKGGKKSIWRISMRKKFGSGSNLMGLLTRICFRP